MGDVHMTDVMSRMVSPMLSTDIHMGITAENICEQWGLTREELDDFAAKSQQKAVAAVQSGRFKDEIVPVEIPQRKGDPIIFDTDEYPKDG